MEKYDYKDLYKMVIEDIPLSDDKKVYGVGFIGPQGIGKSTISKLLSEKLNIYVAINDKIRRMLDNLGIDSSANQPLVEKLAYDRILYMLKNNTSMIIDANILTFYKLVEDNFNKFNAKCFFVKLECSKEELLRRLDYRQSQFETDKTNYSRATKEDYYKYLKRPQSFNFPNEKIFFTIDTEKDLGIQIESLAIKIKSYIDCDDKNNKYDKSKI